MFIMSHYIEAGMYLVCTATSILCSVT